MATFGTMEISAQLEIIKRGTVEVISGAELSEKLKRGRPLRVKAGFDPSAPDIHLGHTVLLRKLRQFQELGHKVIFLIGDATALIGDPSGQSQMRKTLTWDEVEKNVETYVKQVGKILNIKNSTLFERKHNSDWFSRHGFKEKEFPPFTFEQFVELAQKYTVARLLERDDFQKRLKENKPISFLELFYPLMQGYDSVRLEADIEIGGTDQKFNMLVGRDIQQAYNQAPQVVITLPLLEGTDGKQKMSKSLGNYIGITEPPGQMYGKLMSISDELMWRYYELLRDVPLEELDEMKRGAHPKEAKMRLSRELVSQYHSEEAAKKAEAEFEQVHKERKLPLDIPQIELLASERNKEGKVYLPALLLRAKLVRSASEARQLIDQRGIKVNGEKIDRYELVLSAGDVIKVGVRRFLKIGK